MTDKALFGDMLSILGIQSNSDRSEKLSLMLESYEIAVGQEKTAARYGDVGRFFQEQADLADTFARQVERAAIALKRTLRRNPADEFVLFDRIKEHAAKMRQVADEFRSTGGKRNVYKLHRDTPEWLLACDLCQLLKGEKPDSTRDDLQRLFSLAKAYVTGCPAEDDPRSRIVAEAYSAYRSDPLFGIRRRLPTSKSSNG